MRVNIPSLAVATSVNRNNNALTSKCFSTFMNQVGSCKSSSVERDLVAAGPQDCSNFLNGLQSSTDSKRNENFISNTSNKLGNNRPLIGRGGDVEKCKFISAFDIVTFCLLNRITGIDKRQKTNSLHNAAIVHIETRNDSFRKHRVQMSDKLQFVVRRDSQPVSQ